MAFQLFSSTCDVQNFEKIEIQIAASCVATPRCYWVVNDAEKKENYCLNFTLTTAKAAGRT